MENHFYLKYSCFESQKIIILVVEPPCETRHEIREDTETPNALKMSYNKIEKSAVCAKGT